MTLRIVPLAAALAALAATFAALPVAAKNVDAIRKQQVSEIPTCAKPLGTLSVLEPEDATDWWTGYQLPAPSKLIKLFVAKSHCFTLVDRGAGMDAAMRERDLASSGQLRGRSNIGKGQIKAADYVMTPDLVAANSNAGGGAVTGLLGGLIGGKAGAVVGGLDFKSKTANVVLTVTDVRSSEQVAIAEGNAKKTDLGWGGSGALFGASGIGGLGGGAYANTQVGQVITLAYLQAYADIVGQLGGLPANASAANATQAVTVAKPARLLASPDGKGKAVRALEVGMMLYPTGTKNGVMWEVEDEMGNKGWVSSTLLELSK